MSESPKLNSNLTLEKAVEKILQSEQVKLNKVLKAKIIEPEVEKIDRIFKNRKQPPRENKKWGKQKKYLEGVKCTRYGKIQNHENNECIGLTQKCNKCNLRQHFASV